MRKPNLKIKLPDVSNLGIRKPSLKSQRLSMPKPNPKAPKFAADLYADLRDRRLLPLIVLLLVAIVAVPILLAGGGSEDETPPPIATPSAVPTPASFTVVPAQPGLRNYRERLGYRQARNPFRQAASESAASASGSGGETSGTAGEGGASSTETGSEGSSEEAGSGGSETTHTNVVIQKQVIGYSIDTKAGFLGSVSVHKGITPMTQLPSKKNPVVVYVGPSKDKKKALFLMAENVTAFYGKGTCALKQATSCQILALKPGFSATFAYGFGHARYKLYLKQIVAVADTREVDATVTTGK